MAQSYAIAEARANLPTLIDEVEAGAAVELTRRGKVVAVMISVTEYQRLQGKRSSFQEAYQRFLKKHSLAEVGLEPEFARKVRDRSSGRKVDL
ncbi:type II toxin-antitoxin system Phd/YefM family antitoxin [Steroidobacter sp.]|uniref:type II toxin-antitoxin system Phd/YefM family antitoxin n=1 Tax=Steroidobacter sp. TaxID=1978227 RepID=UPI001A61F798|nr:type II toxin-antitoxin system Phd/YefM family antitoxin [Steroidobacter sp.]MBL8271225.1 type II toxin-antitoxin system Phd/YefM family antitoxin [Steroidobacter sp.]